MLPAGLGAGSVDADVELGGSGDGYHWFEPRKAWPSPTAPSAVNCSTATSAAFEKADMAALTELLQADVKLEMPPLPVRFTGRDTVLRFLAARAFTKAGDIVMVPMAANGQPAVAEYRRSADNIMQAHSIQVLTTSSTGIAVMTVFLDPTLFSAFGLPASR